MKSFLKRVLGLQSGSTKGEAQRAAQRARPQVEGLESREAPAFLSLSSSLYSSLYSSKLSPTSTTQLVSYTPTLYASMDMHGPL
jgi:hypothetical protein